MPIPCSLLRVHNHSWRSLWVVEAIRTRCDHTAHAHHITLVSLGAGVGWVGIHWRQLSCVVVIHHSVGFLGDQVRVGRASLPSHRIVVLILAGIRTRCPLLSLYIARCRSRNSHARVGVVLRIIVALLRVGGVRLVSIVRRLLLLVWLRLRLAVHVWLEGGGMDCPLWNL